ncbi:MAG: SMP-30/gluconolactonase/LRE family protein [Rhodospirillales bacterium]|jgi:gluconolactonase
MDWTFDYICKPMGGLTEGPVWDGEVLRFTQIHSSRVLEFDPLEGEISEWGSDTNRTNGLAYDVSGQMFGCSSGGRAILRFDADGTNTVIADKFEEKLLNTPNDLAIDANGRIWFSNPWNAGNVDVEPSQQLDHRSVMRLEPKADGGYTLHRATFDTDMPNGVLLSADQKTLYVAQSNFEPGHLRDLRAYPINDDGSLGTFKLLHVFGEDEGGVHRGVDGMCLDVDGNIVACAGYNRHGPGAMIYVFSPIGRVIETHRTPCRQPTNCCFGGPDLTTLFVTSTDGHLLMAQTDRRGYGLYP